MKRVTRSEGKLNICWDKQDHPRTCNNNDELNLHGHRRELQHCKSILTTTKSKSNNNIKLLIINCLAFLNRMIRTVLKALANEDTLLPTQMFPRLPTRTTFVADTNFVSGTQKCFWFCSETFCVRNKCFPVCAAQETSWATMCPQQCVFVHQGLNCLLR